MTSARGRTSGSIWKGRDHRRTVAGSIGCYVGGRLRAGGAQVTFVGRTKLAQALATDGLRLTDYRGADLRVPADSVRFATTVEAIATADVVLVTVKSAGTDEAGRALAAVLKPGALVVSFQNGLRNDDVLRECLPQHTVLAGMVPFNVVNRGRGHFHQGSEGELAIQRHGALAFVQPIFERAGLPLAEYGDMVGVQWAKLALNLNNAVNALSNRPLEEQLSQRDYRRCLALAQLEALDLLATAGIRTAKLTGVPLRWIPRLLQLPDFLFRVLAKKMLLIDPLARSSMWEDLEAGRRTEIDWLNGEVVRLGENHGRATPVNARLTELVHAAERGGRRDWSGSELLEDLKAAAEQVPERARGARPLRLP